MLAVACMCFAACDSDDAPAGLSAVSDPTVDYAQKYADIAPTFDAQLNAVSLDNPGFKGVVGSADGAGLIVLVDQPVAQARGVTNALAADLVERLGVDPSTLSFETAPSAQARGAAPVAERPDFHVLYEVKTGLRRFLFETDLVLSLDLDETIGRVVVGTASPADADQVRAQMTPAEIAVADFVTEEPAVPFYLISAPASGAASTTSASSTVLPMRSLRDDAFLPLIGGAEINFLGNTSQGIQEFSCTQGPVVRDDNGAYGFLTNSHCTRKYLENTGKNFFQPSVATTNIGYESQEQTYRSGWSVSDGFYADVAFIRTNANVELRGQVTSADNCSVGPGTDCIENGIINNVTGSESYLAVNRTVFKTGRSSGSTAGYISRTCRDIVYELAGFTEDNKFDIQLLCQNEVQYSPNIPSPYQIALRGDSGSPVLANAGIPGSSSYQVAGILHGGVPGQPLFYYSPWENIGTTGRAGTAYGLPVSVVTSSQGAVKNTSGGSSGGGGEPGGCDSSPGGSGDGSTGYDIPQPCP